MSGISTKRRVFEYLKDKYLFYKSTKAFKHRYKNYENSLFKKTLSDEIIERYKERWSAFGKKVEIDTFLLCYNLSGKVDYDIVPENLFAAIIEKKLNPYKELSFFSVKNVYEKWFNNKEVFPMSYFHKIDGIYYDKKFHIINGIKQFIENSTFKYPLILKPSKDTYGGAGVSFVKDKNELLSRINDYSFLVCQEKIEQNEYLSEINDSSVNSVRVCLLKSRGGVFEVLNNTMRFGIDGGLDNETSGGIVCNIDDNGKFRDYALNKYGVKYFEHPNSGFVFKGKKVPFYHELLEISKKISNELILCDLVSLDMALDRNNKWRCIEINLGGQTIRFAQYAGEGFFGKYTDEVIGRTSN